MGVAPDPYGTATVPRRKPVKPLAPARKPAAPSAPDSDPYGLAKLLGKPLNTAPLQSAARTAAAEDTNALVTALQGEQARINTDAAARAAEINRAAGDAAKYQQSLGLGDALSTSLRQAGNDQAGLAAGYTDSFRATIEDANANVQKALGAIGAAPVQDTSQQAGNVVYGVGGAIPANAMLAAAPFVKASLDRLPAQTVGYGQQQAVGALGAGREQAAQLDPRIAEALGGRSKLERDYLSDFTKTAQTDRQNAVGNVFKAIGVEQKDAAARATAAYHRELIAERAASRKQTAADKAADRAATKAYRDTYLAHLQAGDDERAAHDKALEAAATARQETADYNATTSRINARTSQTRASSSAAATRERVAISRANATTSRARALGYLTDDHGNIHVLPGFKQKPDGTIVKVATTKPGTKNGVSATSYAKLKKDAAKAADLFYWGKPPDANKVSLLMQREGITREQAEQLVGGVPGVDYKQALAKLIHDYSLTRADAVTLLNDLYAPGERGRPSIYSSPGPR